jgi:hypothetical protein
VYLTKFNRSRRASSKNWRLLLLMSCRRKYKDYRLWRNSIMPTSKSTFPLLLIPCLSLFFFFFRTLDSGDLSCDLSWSISYILWRLVFPIILLRDEPCQIRNQIAKFLPENGKKVVQFAFLSIPSHKPAFLQNYHFPHSPRLRKLIWMMCMYFFFYMCVNSIGNDV